MLHISKSICPHRSRVVVYILTVCVCVSSWSNNTMLNEILSSLHIIAPDFLTHLDELSTTKCHVARSDANQSARGHSGIEETDSDCSSSAGGHTTQLIADHTHISGKPLSSICSIWSSLSWPVIMRSLFCNFRHFYTIQALCVYCIQTISMSTGEMLASGVVTENETP